MTTQVNGDTGVSAVQSGVVQQGDLAANVVGNGPTFIAATNASQSALNGTWTKIAFDYELSDTNNNYDPTTNYRFTPSVAGYYQVNISANTQAPGGGFFIAPYKNGAQAYNISQGAAVTTGAQLSVSGLIYLNGSTDYLEAYFSQNAGSTQVCQGKHFSAYLVRVA